MTQWWRSSGLISLAALLPTAAHAQVGTSLTLASDARFRGGSLSNGHPVAILGLSYDHSSGIYLGGSLTGVIAEGAPHLLGREETIGWSARITTQTALDLGISDTHYTHYFSGARSAGYDEFYFGIVTRGISAHVHYSPNYFRAGTSTIYADIAAVLPAGPHRRFDAHIGVTTMLAGARPQGVGRGQYDWQIGVSQDVGQLDLHLGWSGRGPDPDYYQGRGRGHDRLALSATYIF